MLPGHAFKHMSYLWEHKEVKMENMLSRVSIYGEQSDINLFWRMWHKGLKIYCLKFIISG